MSLRQDLRNWWMRLKELSSRMLRPREHSFRDHVLRWNFLATVAILLYLSSSLSHLWVLRYAGYVGHDALLSVTSARKPAHCQIISISEDEYDEILGAGLPIRRLTSLLNAILRFGPAVLVVDIDTSAPRFRDLPLPETATRIVWARAARLTRQSWAPLGVLGHRSTDPPYWGLALIPLDPDSMVRGYQRWVELPATKVPSLHWQALRAYCDYGSQRACAVIGNDSGDTGIRQLDYHFHFGSIPASDVPLASVAPSQDNVLRGKIVILGAGDSDQHLTPFGVISGAEITGAAIETELESKASRRLAGVWMLLIKASLALLLAFVYHFLRPPFALLAALGVLGGVVVGAFFAFYYGSVLVDFMPFLVGVWIEQLYDATVEA